MSQNNRSLDRDESNILKLIVEMGDLTEKALSQSLNCVAEYQPELSQSIIENDSHINALHRRIEEECFTVTALQQPVASDLRDLFTDVYIAIELERIADLAADIAGIMLQMGGDMNSPFKDTVLELGKSCSQMLTDVIQAYRLRDVEKARVVAKQDDVVDSTEQQLIEDVLQYMSSHPEASRHLSQTMWIAHTFERIGDRITNIAERTVFMVSGSSVELN